MSCMVHLKDCSLCVCVCVSRCFYVHPMISAHHMHCCATGRGVVEVMHLVEAYKNYSKYASQALKAVNLPKLGKGGKDMPISGRHMQQTLQRMSGALPPAIIKQMGGMGGLQQLMKSMESMGK